MNLILLYRIKICKKEKNHRIEWSETKSEECSVEILLNKKTVINILYLSRYLH